METLYNPELKWYNLPEKNEFIKILQDQGVSNFDPVKFYKEANKDEILEKQNSKLTKKQKKKMKKSKAALRIIEANIKKKELSLRKDEDRKIDFFLDTCNTLNEMSKKLKQMVTNYGRIKLKSKLLNKCINENNILASHLMFFSLNCEEIDDKELKKLCDKILLKYKGIYKNKDLIKIQMTEMSSYLPPLDPFKKKVLKLDKWQTDVFKSIENNENILIVAPTSAGKTVCSTYCAVLGNKTLFVVPSDELARQVAGIFRNMNLNIGLITNNEYFMEENFNVLVGTPYKLEEYLILNDHKVFKYVIYDEIQMLNSEEGGSFEKIIKLMECPFLGLSATIEKPHILQQWLEKIKKTKVKLVLYHKRFIVQQRYLWQDKLVHLHPLSCVNVDYLQTKEFLKSEMSFTAHDSYDLYLKLKDNEVNVDSPGKFLKKGKWDQITLTETISYEKYLKELMAKLSKDNRDIVKKILHTYEVIDEKMDINLIKLIQTLFRKKMTPMIIFKIDPDQCKKLFIKLVDALETAQKKKYPYHYDDLEVQYNIYSEYLNSSKDMSNLSIPKDQDPSVYLEQERRRIENKFLDKLKDSMRKILTKRINKLDGLYPEHIVKFYKNYYTLKLNKILNLEHLVSIDKNRPHPDFMFNHMGVTSDMMRNFRRRLKQGLGHNIDWGHPFLRGIERGIAPYFRNMSTPFQLLVQSLYSTKVIPVVISDESLGYGINMPIRTVVILGSKDGEEIDVLTANQMSGRSGRRGVDNEGNIVYVGVNWRDILKGNYVSLEGKDPRDSHIMLPLYCNKMSKQDVVKLSGITLKQHVNNYNYTLKEQISEMQKLINSNNYCKHEINSLIIWGCRYYGKNSFLLPTVLIKLLEIKEKKKNINEDIIRYFSYLFDDTSTLIEDKSNEFISLIDKDIYQNIYDGEDLVKAIKSGQIMEDQKDLINRLRLIGNSISSVYECIKKTKYNKLVLNLKNTHNEIKNLINKNKF